MGKINLPIEGVVKIELLKKYSSIYIFTTHFNTNFIKIIDFSEVLHKKFV
jgi:hypothetical protein